MLKNMKIGMRLGTSFGLILLMLAALGVYVTSQITSINDSIDLVVQDRMVKTRQTNDIVNNLNIAARGIRNLMLLDDSAKIRSEKIRLDSSTEANTKLYDSLQASVKDEEGRKILSKAGDCRKVYASTRAELVDLIQKGRKADALAVLFGSYRQAQNDYMAAVSELSDFQSDLAQKDGVAAGAIATRLKTTLIVVISAMILLSFLIAWVLTRSIVRPINDCIAATGAIARGEIPKASSQESWGEFEAMRLSLNNCIQGLHGLEEAEHFLQRMAVNDYTVSVSNAYPGIYSRVIDATTAVKTRIVHAIEIMQKIAVGELEADLADLKRVGKRSEQDTFIPAYIGAMEAIRALIVDVDTLAKAAVDGRLTVRADATTHKGDYRKIVQGFNDTLDALIGPINVTAKYVEDISKGVIPPVITDNYNGDFNVTKTNLNSMVKMMSDLLRETDVLVKAAMGGSLATRANAQLFVGGWNELVAGINKTLDAVLEPINEAAGILEKVAERDMTVRMQGSYQGDHAKIKDALNSAVDNLEKALAQVSDSTGQVSGASQQIASGSQNLAQGANEQASSLEEVSASLEEMASMTRQNADNALAAKNLANEADGNTRTGLDAMTKMSSAINKIKESSDQTAKIVKTIDEIAMQTNLLALNAAVEAARAGEAGRGFAVVAEEVRNLAQRSAQAAKNTADMIAESVRNAGDGVVIVDSVALSLDRIAGSIRKVNDLIGEIAAASKEQSQGIKEVNEAVSQMDKVTQQNAANAEESASSSEELSSQAEELQGMVAQFRIRSTGQVINSGRPVHAQRAALPPPRAEKNGVHLVGANQLIPLDNEGLKEF